MGLKTKKPDRSIAAHLLRAKFNRGLIDISEAALEAECARLNALAAALPVLRVIPLEKVRR